jgi:hypothetical protein
MKQILLKLGLFFSLMMIPIITFFTLPYSEEFAYHYIENDCYNHGSWIYDRINHNPSPIDVAFIGSSHTIHAIQDKKTEELLGQNIHIANLGYCRYGRNIEYLILKMLLKYKSPKLIVIEVHEDEEKNSHDIFPYLAETKDLLLPPTSINRDYLSDLIQGGSARLEYFKTTYIFRKTYPEPTDERYGYAATDRQVSGAELEENKRVWKNRLSQINPEIIENIQAKFPLAYLNEMVKILQKKSIPFMFIYLPESGSSLQKPKYASLYQDLAPLIIPPQSIFDEPSNWMDASHLNDKGSEILSTWLAEHLKSDLCADSSAIR